MRRSLLQIKIALLVRSRDQEDAHYYLTLGINKRPLAVMNIKRVIVYYWLRIKKPNLTRLVTDTKARGEEEFPGLWRS